MTTFTNWQSTFRFDSLHEMAFGQDDDDLEDQMKAGMRVFDEDGTFAEELETSVKGGNPVSTFISLSHITQTCYLY